MHPDVIKALKSALYSSTSTISVADTSKSHDFPALWTAQMSGPLLCEVLHQVQVAQRELDVCGELWTNGRQF